MDIGFYQEQKQTQMLSRDMVQSLEILRMPISELREIILAEGLKNPTVDVIDRNFSAQKNPQANNNLLENIADSESLEEHILSQASDLSLKEKKILDALISQLDERGFIDTDYEKISQICDSSESEISKIHNFLKTLSPIGIGAKNLQECLEIQLDNLEISDRNLINFAKIVIKNNFDELLKGNIKNFRKLAEKHHINISDFSKIFARLDFSPAKNFRRNDNFSIIPEIKIRKINNEWHIDINSDYLPTIRVSNSYKKLLLNGQNLSKQDILKIRSERKHGEFIEKSVKKRQKTLLLIAQIILKQQEAFFENGIIALKKMSLKDISSEAKLHESTISRAIANKYIDTPHGIFAITKLFSSGSTDQKKISSISIKEQIRKLLLQTKNQNLTDQAICDILKKENIVIARRTISKYRNQLNLPNSRNRKI